MCMGGGRGEERGGKGRQGGRQGGEGREGERGVERE